MSLGRIISEPMTSAIPLLHIALASLSIIDASALFNGDPINCYIFASVSLAFLFVSMILQFVRRPDGMLFTLALGANLPSLIVTFAGIYRGFGLHSEDMVVYPDRVSAVYFSIVTITTLGYGDMLPRNDIEIIAAIEALAGMIMFGLFVGLTVYLLEKAAEEHSH